MIYSLIKNKISILFLFALIFSLFAFLGSATEVQAQQSKCANLGTAITCKTLIKAAKDNPSTLCGKNTAVDSCSPAECARLNSQLSNCGLGGNPDADSQTEPIASVVGKLLRGLFGLMGTIFLVLVIYGGFIWMTAGGSEENINKAKKIITQATIGLIVVVVAYALTDFIFDTIITATETTL